MQFNLREIPFSHRGSYFAISCTGEKFLFRDTVPAMYLRTIHGSAEDPFVARFLFEDDTPIREDSCSAQPEVLTIRKDGKSCRIAFADPETLLFSGNLPIQLDFMSENHFVFPQPFRSNHKDYYLVNHYQNNCRYMLHAQQGSLTAIDCWDGTFSSCCKLVLAPDASGTYLISLEEAFTEWIDRMRHFDFEAAVSCSAAAFEEFYQSMPSVPANYQEVALLSSYINWESIVKPCGLLTRDAMLMSKNWMCSVWSWDHCINAFSLMYHRPKEAWDQFMLMFDHQTGTGAIPDSINDCKAVYNYAKPPIHGWTLRKMMTHMELSNKQKQEAYEKLAAWTGWWLNCHDANGDGLCEYTHGNDSGWDNSTAFLSHPPVTLPDLAAYLILQMDVLKELAEELAYSEDAILWETKKEAMLAAMLKNLFPKELPLVLHGLENTPGTADSLILYLPIVLGELLPENIRKRLIAVLKSDTFNTAYGLATESPKSSYYMSDGYWRGPIWAPSTLILLDGLWQCGEKEFVVETARKYCDMVRKSGCSENYDALTGEGLRDRAYTWAASVMLVLAHEYLS